MCKIIIGAVIIGMLLSCTDHISNENSIEYCITIPIKYESDDSVLPIKYFVSRIKTNIGYSGEEKIDTLWNSQITFSIHDVNIDSVYFELVLWNPKGKLVDTLINVYSKEFLIEDNRLYKSYTCDTILVSNKLAGKRTSNNE